MNIGTKLVSNERRRVVKTEGYDASHDDQHVNGEMVMAAIMYAMPPEMRHRNNPLAKVWPWAYNYWKPSPQNRVRELVKAGQLICAEIDRLKRQEK